MKDFKDFVEAVARRAGFDAVPEECQHQNTELRARTIRGGSRQYVRQCLFCGEPVGNPQKQSGEVAPFDEELRSTYAERRRKAMASAQQEKRTEWWGNYREYMASQEWSSLRAKVLERDGHLCRGCLTVQATDVHHTTYAHFGAEFAFELLSLCRPCHERFHTEGDE
jgi:5-methylcytosine-specific restriction endonuclease McrA